MVGPCRVTRHFTNSFHLQIREKFMQVVVHRSVLPYASQTNRDKGAVYILGQGHITDTIHAALLIIFFHFLQFQVTTIFLRNSFEIVPKVIYYSLFNSVVHVEIGREIKVQIVIKMVVELARHGYQAWKVEPLAVFCLCCYT